MPINKKDIKDFFVRHPEHAGAREETEKMAQGSSTPEGIINSGAIDWIFRDKTLAEKFVVELTCPKI